MSIVPPSTLKITQKVSSPKRIFELGQIEKYENCSFGHEKLFLETRLFIVFVNTWYTESILFWEKIHFVR